jgi:O-antigen/teichoic acid export membrane protein
LAQRVILAIFGAEYTNSILVLQILVWSSVFIYMSTSFGYVFQALNKQIIQTKVAGICMTLNVVLNLVLIPKYSYVAASAIAVATELISSALYFVWGSKIAYSLFNRNSASIIAKVLISSALMGLFIIYFHNLSLLALVPLAAALYFVVLYIIRGINREDIDLARRATGRQR